MLKDRRHVVITLCGSTRFRSLYESLNEELTLKGYCVLSVGVFQHPEKEKYRSVLESIHFQKIRMADIIAVINKDGYIGRNTQLEILYAQTLSKPIIYLEAAVTFMERLENLVVNLRSGRFG